MKLPYVTRWVGVVGLSVALGCQSLDVQNPNAPDASRAFADPGAIAGLISGGYKSWFNAHGGFDSALLLNHMADGLTSSWNNFNIRYYTSEGNECPVRCGWDNRPTSSYRFEIETYWYGYYGAASAAIDALGAIRNGKKVVIGTAANTKIIEVGAQMLLAMSMAQIALNYDQGFVLDENIPRDANGIPQVKLVGRAVVKTAAIAAFEKAITLARAGPNFTAPAEWFGKTSQPSYDRNGLVKVMRTMEAELLAYFPRNGAEATQVSWQQVAAYAAQGLSNSGVDWGYFHDSVEFFDGVKQWGNDITTTRVDTRVARLITDGPDGEAARHQNPWPEPDGNPQPNAFDHRVGNGTWGQDDDFLGVGTLAWDGGEGTDFAYASAASFRPARGQYHQSNLGAIRYSYLAYPGYGLPGEDGTGFAPQFTPTVNDLLWAEALIETGSLAQGADLINKTRVDRGNLPAATAAQGKAELLKALRYEQDVELFTLSAMNYYNRRRIDDLKSGTARQMPVPAKELQVLQEELYTFGGPTDPGTPAKAPGVDGQGRRIRNVRDIWAEMEGYSRQQARRRNRN